MARMITFMTKIYQAGSDIALEKAMSPLCQNIWFQLPVVCVCVCVVCRVSCVLWSTIDARNLFNSAASRPISNAKAKTGRAIQLGSPSPAPASTANMTMPVTVALL